MRLEARDLSVTLGERKVVDGASLALEGGSVVGLLGPNGAGKSSLMRALAGLLPCRGDVSIGGDAVASLPRREVARRIAYMAQARTIAWPLSVENVVALGRLPWRGHASGPSPADATAVADAMELMDVAHLAGRPATELSGGEQARVLAARAMAQQTPVLIVDEPVSGLDPAHQMTMMQALRRRAAGGCAILVSLHELSLAARWCDRVVLMRKGSIAADGAPREALTPTMLASVFGIVVHQAEDSCGMILTPVGLSDPS